MAILKFISILKRRCIAKDKEVYMQIPANITQGHKKRREIRKPMFMCEKFYLYICT